MAKKAVGCRKMKRLLYRFLDDELPRERVEAIERHLDECLDCRNHATATASLEERLRVCLESGPAPADLWPRIQASLSDRELGAATPKKPPARRVAQWMWLGAAAAVVVVALFMLRAPMEEADSLDDRLVTLPVHDLATFIAAERPLDVASADPEFLRAWFQPKMNFAVPRPPNAHAAELVGGRLCYFLERRVASFMYRHEGRYLSLFVMEEEGLPQPAGERVLFAGHEAVLRDLEGFTHMIWRRSDLLYSLVSDLPRERLIRIAETFTEPN